MTGELINHLWQSTLFAVVAGLAAVALRKNRAQVRYWVWFAASVKFLVPFAVLMSFGSRLPQTKTVAAPPALASAVVEIAQPFVETPAPHPATLARSRDWTPIAIFGLWAFGFLGVALIRFRDWLRVRAAVRSSILMDIPAPVEVRSSPGLLEPGVVGIFRPFLLLPEGIAQRLTPPQLEAVLAHELCHVRRRDNLFASIHMMVEAMFWFHPLVWWIGARLVEERERACDEEVLRLGSEPREYAEGILSVCKLYVESPLTCVSGVTGSDLRKRILAIMTGHVATDLDLTKKLALAAAGMAALALPILIGVLDAPVIQAQNAPPNTPKFEVASIKACSEPLNDGGPHSSPGRLATDCAQLLNLIGNAYNAFADGHLNLNAEPTPITGGPTWIHTASYDINAKAEGNPSKEMMFGPMMQALLEDRFQLKIHRQTSEGPVYFLTVARGGPKLQPSEGNCTLYYGAPRPPLPQGQKYCERMISGIKPSVQADDATLDEFSKMLRMVVGRPVIDKTGITGRFDLRVEFAREGTELAAIHLVGPPPASDPAGPPEIFTALQEQLRLKLESGRGPVDTLVIDQIEKPSAN